MDNIYNSIIEEGDACYAYYYALNILGRHDEQIYNLIIKSKIEYLINKYNMYVLPK